MIGKKVIARKRACNGRKNLLLIKMPVTEKMLGKQKRAKKKKAAIGKSCYEEKSLLGKNKRPP